MFSTFQENLFEKTPPLAPDSWNGNTPVISRTVTSDNWPKLIHKVSQVVNSGKATYLDGLLEELLALRNNIGMSFQDLFACVYKNFLYSEWTKRLRTLPGIIRIWEICFERLV